MARFMPGESGNPNGRPKGSTTGIKKKYSTTEIVEMLDALDCNPVEGLVKLAKEGYNDRIKLDAYAELLSYIAPKLKAVELKMDEQQVPFIFHLDIGGNNATSIDDESR